VNSEHSQTQVLRKVKEDISWKEFVEHINSLVIGTGSFNGSLSRIRFSEILIGIQGDEAAKSRMSGEVISRNVWMMNDRVFIFIFYFL